MTVSFPSACAAALQSDLDRVLRASESAWIQGRRDPDACDFFTGDPQEDAVPGHVEVLQKYLVPQTRSWHGYAWNMPVAREAAANGLSEWCGVPFEPGDIYLTNGCFAALDEALSHPNARARETVASSGA